MGKIFKGYYLIKLLLIILCAIKAGYAHSFYENKAQGWFWYKEVKRIEEIEEEQEDYTKTLKEELITQDPITKTLDETEVFSEDGLFRASLLKRIIPDALNKALDNPTYENVENFYFLQKMALDKSQKFEDISRRIPLLDPQYDELRNRPQSPHENLLHKKAAEKKRLAIFKKIAQKAGIFFIYKGSCSKCHLAKRQVNALSQYGFKIIAISADDLLFKDLMVEKNVSDKNIPLMLGITSVPSLVLVAPDSEQKFTVLTSSLLKDSDLYARIIEGGNMLGIASK